MARKKTPPDRVGLKARLSERLREARTAIYGERGGPELARGLGVPARTWYNYEVGVTMPAEVPLRFLEATGVEPRWLLHGEGPMRRGDHPQPGPSDAGTAATPTADRPPSGLVGELLGRLSRGELRLRWELVGPGARRDGGGPASAPDAGA